MTVRRVVLLVTCLLVSVLAVWFALDQRKLSTIATAVSALVAVAALGIGVWTTLRSGMPAGPGSVSAAPTIRVADTGSAEVGADGDGNTGALFHGSPPASSVTVENSGQGKAGARGRINTGFEQK